MALGEPVPCGNYLFVGPVCPCYAALTNWEGKWQVADRAREQAEYVIREVCNELDIDIEFPLRDHDVGYLIWELTKRNREA